jgi:hypothetical protein
LFTCEKRTARVALEAAKAMIAKVMLTKAMLAKAMLAKAMIVNQNEAW